MGIVEESCRYRVREVSNRGNIVLSRNLGCKTRGVAMWLNAWPRVAYPKNSSSTGHNASCVYCYPPWEKFVTAYGDRMGIVEQSWGYRGQYSGEIRFIEKPGVQDEGSRHVAKHSSDPRVAYPWSQSSGTGPNVSCEYCWPLYLMGIGTWEKIVLSSHKRVNGHRRPSASCSYCCPLWPGGGGGTQEEFVLSSPRG